MNIKAISREQFIETVGEEKTRGKWQPLFKRALAGEILLIETGKEELEVRIIAALRAYISRQRLPIAIYLRGKQIFIIKRQEPGTKKRGKAKQTEEKRQ